MKELTKYDALQILVEAKQTLKPTADDVVSRQFILGSLYALNNIIQDGPEFVTEKRILDHLIGVICTFKDCFQKELDELHADAAQHKGA